MSTPGQRITQCVDNLPEAELMKFKIEYLKMPRDIAEHPFFAKANNSKWLWVPNQLRDYLAERKKSRISSSNSTRPYNGPSTSSGERSHDASSRPGRSLSPPVTVNKIDQGPSGAPHRMSSKATQDGIIHLGTIDLTETPDSPVEMSSVGGSVANLHCIEPLTSDDDEPEVISGPLIKAHKRRMSNIQPTRIVRRHTDSYTAHGNLLIDLTAL